jgi:hypothetical protein
MALVFPRPMTLVTAWAKPRLTLHHRQEISRQAGGQAQAKDLGPSLWMADFVSVPLPLDEADAVRADFDSLSGAVNSFYLHPPTRRRPASLASHAPLQGASITVHAVSTDRSALQLAGLPVGTELRAGDYLSVHTTSVAREFMRLVTGGVADGAGITPELTVTPFCRASVAAAQGVSLLDPMVEMVLEPGSLDDPYVGPSHRTIQLRAVQVVR